jgi:hypothetical protein
MFDALATTMPRVSPLAWLMIALMFAGIAIRLFRWRPYLEAHIRRYNEAPPRGWLWTPVDDPEVERMRRIMVVGSVLAIVGSVGLFVMAIAGIA